MPNSIFYIAFLVEEVSMRNRIKGNRKLEQRGRNYACGKFRDLVFDQNHTCGKFRNHVWFCLKPRLVLQRTTKGFTIFKVKYCGLKAQ